MDNRNRDNIPNNRTENRDVERERFERHDRNRDRVINESERREHDTTHYKNRDENRRLHFLDDLSDYKVASDDPDVRGWDVVDVNDRKVGKVDNLLVDIRREKVRYLDVDIDKDLLGKDHDELANSNASGVHEYRKKGGDVHMIVPIGLARLDKSNKRVISDEINSNILQQGHFHKRGEHITPEYERNVVSSVRTYENSGDLGSINRTGSVGSPTGATGTPTGTSSTPITGTDTAGTSDTRNPESRTRTGDTENREMRRPETSRDTDLSRPSETERNEFGSESYRSDRDLQNRSGEESFRESRDRGPNTRDRSLADQNLERRTGESQNRGPIQDDFYDNRYFDERRFYGRQ